MQSTRGYRPFTLVLVFGATVFGMVLAGGTNLTPVTRADTGEIKHAVSVTPTPGGLPTFADLAEAVSPADPGEEDRACRDPPARVSGDPLRALPRPAPPARG